MLIAKKKTRSDKKLCEVYTRKLRKGTAALLLNHLKIFILNMEILIFE